MTKGQRPKTLLQLVYLRRQNEITLRQTVNFVSPDCDLRISPPKTNVWMMTLFFGEGSNLIYKVLRCFEVCEAIGFFQVVVVNYFPTVELFEQWSDLLAC